jgi:hypothetical protein
MLIFLLVWLVLGLLSCVGYYFLEECEHWRDMSLAFILFVPLMIIVGGLCSFLVVFIVLVMERNFLDFLLFKPFKKRGRK